MDSSEDDVTVRFTQTESLSTFEYDVTLEKSQCSYLELDVYGTDPRAMATVAGSVRTATGPPVDKDAVSLNNGVEDCACVVRCEHCIHVAHGELRARRSTKLHGIASPLFVENLLDANVTHIYD